VKFLKKVFLSFALIVGIMLNMQAADQSLRGWLGKKAEEGYENLPTLTRKQKGLAIGSIASLVALYLLYSKMTARTITMEGSTFVEWDKGILKKMKSSKDLANYIGKDISADIALKPGPFTPHVKLTYTINPDSDTKGEARSDVTTFPGNAYYIQAKVGGNTGYYLYRPGAWWWNKMKESTQKKVNDNVKAWVECKSKTISQNRQGNTPS